MDKYFATNSKESIQITFDGEENTVYNGITDWLYEEEIFLHSTALFWSPSENKLAYVKFNDSNVDYYMFPIYDGTQYNYVNKIRYPKADAKNPIVKVFIYDSVRGSTRGLEPPVGLT